MPSPSEKYSAAARRLAERTGNTLVRIFDDVDDLTIAGSLAFHMHAEPVVRAAATASVDLTRAYASTFTDTLTDPSDLLVDDAVTYLFDPYDRFASQVGKGGDVARAAASARSVVLSVGRDAVYRTSRQAMAEMAVHSGNWVRLVTGSSCKWCMSLSGVVFSSAEAASFGHPSCDCVPVPAEIGEPQNAKTRKAAGWDEQAETNYKHRTERNALKRQVASARRSQERARRDQITETDPTRRERLSIREQEWETRAERAAERLRIIETGTHRL